MMKAGLYYIGDLCYVLHDEWDECCELFFEGRNDHGCNQGEFQLKDGRLFANFNTAHGDGTYTDQGGSREYPVDSGSIGCILVKDVDVDNKNNRLDYGNTIKFEDDFEVGNANGTIIFGHIRIKTK